MKNPLTIRNGNVGFGHFVNSPPDPMLRIASLNFPGLDQHKHENVTPGNLSGDRTSHPLLNSKGRQKENFRKLCSNRQFRSNTGLTKSIIHWSIINRHQCQNSTIRYSTTNRDPKGSKNGSQQKNTFFHPPI